MWTVAFRLNDIAYSFKFDSYELAFAKFLYYQGKGYAPNIHQ